MFQTRLYYCSSLKLAFQVVVDVGYSLRYELVYLSLYKVADTPFHMSNLTLMGHALLSQFYVEFAF